MNHILYIVMDSARFDSVKKARTPWLKKLGVLQRRYSYASWTAPSHYAYFMGLTPHQSPKKIFASMTYRSSLLEWRKRLSLPRVEFEHFLPELSLPVALKRFGYKSRAEVSLPVLNPSTFLAPQFDSYRLRDKHNDFVGMVRDLEWNGEPTFTFLNCGETHYPYVLPGEISNLPKIHGLHGTLKKMGARRSESAWFTPKVMKQLNEKQIQCVEYMDSQLEEVFRRCPSKTWIIVTSDHGELFGEDGYFGHGPILHEKVFEVPFVEGLVP